MDQIADQSMAFFPEHARRSRLIADAGTSYWETESARVRPGLPFLFVMLFSAGLWVPVFLAARCAWYYLIHLA